MSEEAKAVREIAKTAGKAIDASREVGGFIARFIGGPLEQGMGIFEDRLKYMRWERQQRLMQRAQQFMTVLGQSGPIRHLPLNFAIPLMQAASLEEDDTLQDIWAALLVNAAASGSSKDIRRSYIAILEQLTPLDAKILEAIYSLTFEENGFQTIATAGLPNRVRIAEVDGDGDGDGDELPPEEVVLSLSNLERLGCLRPVMTIDGGALYTHVSQTIAGKAFVEACRIPRS